ncbi:MAG TPA: efflux RND transporter periplasmic adaptor subunit [Bryobacteraceae bacterium]|nr:efflux RND transporter periplasmic adaptor subunit [Bryobacteraceae bacterium]
MLRWSLLFAVLLIAVGCSGPYSPATVKATGAKRPPVVRVRTVELESIPEVITATGELLAEDQATLRAKVPGRVAKVHVDLGSRMNEGDVVAELEREDYELRLKQAEAALEQTRARAGLGPNDGDQIDPEKTSVVRQAAASLKEATLMHANASELFKKGIVSNVDFQRAGVALQAAEARRQAAVEEVYRARAEIMQRRQEIALAKQQLTDTVIRAPFRGAITQRIATLGEYLATNAPAVVLVRWHPLRVRLQVPERQAFKVKSGQRIDLTLEGQAVPKPGRVVRMSPAIEAQNRSLLVEGEVPNEDGRLRAGSFVEGTITVNAQARGIAVPAKSVLSFAGVDRAFVVASGVLVERQIKLGRRLDGDRREVAEGLKVGEQLVLEPSDHFAAGQKVDAARQ